MYRKGRLKIPPRHPIQITTPMNSHPEFEPPKHVSQRLLLSGALMLLGLIGICWASFRHAAAESDTARRFAFLDEFDEEKRERAAQVAHRLRESRHDTSTTEKVDKQGVQRGRSVVSTEKPLKLEREEDYFAPNLSIDLSDAAIESRLAKDVRYLSSDELEGRGIRTNGLVLAGDFLAEEFKKAGLYSAWYNESPFQEFQLLNGSSKGVVQRVMFHRKNDEKYLLTPNVDFSSLIKTTMGTMTLDVVFVGYGITAPEFNYDDYKGVRVAGKAVVILRNEPSPSDPKSPFAGADASRHSPVYTKIQNAIAHGATAVILCDRPSVEHANNDDGDPLAGDLLKIEFADNSFDTTIPVIHCRQALLAEMFEQYEDQTLSEVVAQIDNDSTPRSRQIEGFQIGFEVTRNRSGREVRNVLASIEPNGPMPARTIIIGAHYDHLGRDGWGSLAVGADGEIHNGADDNASGTATIVEIARQLASRRDQLKCRILFIAFTAEELGLIGSKHYVRDPAVPLSQTMAMINLDMVGRLREELTIYGVGTAREWNDLLEPVTAENSLNVKLRSSGYGPSDHAVFYEKGIPVLHFFTGFHPQYHRPADDSHLLNIQGMRQISRCVAELVTELATQESPLSKGTAPSDGLFGDGTFAELIDQPKSDPPKFGVVVKTVNEGGKGLLIRKVLPSSVASNNGLKPGDVITKVGDSNVTTVEELKSSISQFTSGVKVPIKITRRSLDLEIEVNF